MHCTAWQEAYRGIVSDRYLDTMTVEATTARARLSDYNTIFVWVFENNERAIRFYHKYGFEFDGSKKEWNLGGPLTIVRMVKNRC